MSGGQPQDTLGPQGSNVMHDGVDSLNQHSSPNQQHNNVRRRPSRAGTRSVSTLSAAQLERKRANDREAQRAIRQRTKENTERLERRVQELETQLEAVGGANPQVSALLDRIRALEQDNADLRLRVEQAEIATGLEPGALLGDSQNRASNHSNGSLPSMPQPQIGQAQMAASMLQHGAELSRPPSNYGHRQPSEWQQNSAYGAHSGIQRDTTPSNTGEHSPDTMTGWSGDRNRAPEYQPAGQPQDYAHMLNSQQLRAGNQSVTYPPPHESHAYPVPPHNQAMSGYSPAHGHRQQPYMPPQPAGGHAQHPQPSGHAPQPGHPQQSPHLQQLPAPHSGGSADRGGQPMYYQGFPQG